MSICDYDGKTILERRRCYSERLEQRNENEMKNYTRRETLEASRDSERFLIYGCS